VILRFAVLQFLLTGYGVLFDIASHLFLSIAPWALPWLILNSAFAGYTAYTLSHTPA